MTTSSPADATSDPVGLDLASLTDYLSEHIPDGLSAPLSAKLIAGGRSNPTYELSDGSHHWILRRPPLGEVFKSAHDMSRESRIVSALRDSSVPVATVVATCATSDVIGAPFYVMAKLEGRTLRTHADTATLSQSQRHGLSTEFVDLLVRLHNLEPAQYGLSDFGRPDGYLDRQLARWTRQWAAVATRGSQGIEQLTDRLRNEQPGLRYPGIVHGDFKIDNVMVAAQDPTSIIALLDWEMATLGDTLADLGQLVSFWDEPGMQFNPITAGATAHEGFLTASEVIARYAAARDVDPSDLEWYVAFADFKLAVILEQIHARYLAGQTVGDWFDDIGDMVEPLIECAFARISNSSRTRSIS